MRILFKEMCLKKVYNRYYKNERIESYGIYRTYAICRILFLVVLKMKLDLLKIFAKFLPLQTDLVVFNEAIKHT